MLKSQSNSVERSLVLRPSTGFLSAPGTALTSPSDAGKSNRRGGAVADVTDESGSVLSPLRVFAGGRRGTTRSGIVAHSSFNSYFRPALLVRRRHTLLSPAAAGLSPRTAAATEHSVDQATPTHTPTHTPTAELVSASPPPPQRLYRKRESCSSRCTAAAAASTSTRGTVRSPSVSGGPVKASAALRRRSVYGHVTAGAGHVITGALPLGRRNTVAVGAAGSTAAAAALESPPPIPLSLREIYRLSRNGSLRHSRHDFHARRRSTMSNKDAVGSGAVRRMSSRASVGAVARRESARSQRASVGSWVNPAAGDAAAADNYASALDVRRRRSRADSIRHHHHHHQQQQQHEVSDTDQPHQYTHHDTDDVCKTPTFDIILV